MTIINQIVSYEEEVIDQHLHGAEYWDPVNPSVVYAPATAGVNVYGAWVALFGGVVTTAPFTDYHRVVMCNPLANPIPADGVYEIAIGTGLPAAQVQITSMKFYIDSAAGSLSRSPMFIQCPRIPVGTLVWVRARCNLAAVQTMNLTLGYHTYTL